MLKLLVCVSTLIAVVGAEYSFLDSDFNKLLVADISTQFNGALQVRLKRDADQDVESNAFIQTIGGQEWDYHCCSGGRANPQELDAIKEVKRNCIAEVRGDTANEVSYDPLTCNDIQSRRKQIVCVGECIAKEFGLIAENGDLKRDTLLEHSRKIIGDHKWKAEVVEEYVDKCLDELKASTELSDTCNPYPLQFHHCIWRAFVQGCPAELQINTRRCRKIRQRFASSDMLNVHNSLRSHFHSHH